MSIIDSIPTLAIRAAGPTEPVSIGPELQVDGQPLPWPTVSRNPFWLDLDPDGLAVLHVAIPVRIVPWAEPVTPQHQEEPA